MPLNVKAGGSWRTASKVYAKVSGAWVTAKELWGYMSGGWRSAWKNEIRYINTSNRTAASIFELMGSPTQPNTYIFENQATITAGTGSYALRTGVFPAGSILKIVNKGYIVGKGGDGGANTGGAGGAGANALYIDMNCELDNGAGYVFGGGGGGGGYRAYYSSGPQNYDIRAGGGGGAGGNGGTGVASAKVGSVGTAMNITSGGNGTITAGGAGGVARSDGTLNGKTQYEEVTGGNGGGPGVAGGQGSFVRVGLQGDMKNVKVPGAGGAAGAAIVKNGKTVTITAGNDTNRIRGAIV